MKNILITCVAIFVIAMIATKFASGEGGIFSSSDKTQVNQVASKSKVRNLNPTVTLTADRSGHFTARGRMNGRHVDFLVDTGASLVFISRKVARRIGIDLRKLRYDQMAQTAAGKIKFAYVTIKEIRIGSIRVRNIKTAVSFSENISNNLLGMSFLSQIKSFEFKGSRLILRD